MAQYLFVLQLKEAIRAPRSYRIWHEWMQTRISGHARIPGRLAHPLHSVPYQGPD